MEERIMTEVTELIEILKQDENKPIKNVKDKLHFAVVNSLWAIVTGRHAEDPKHTATKNVFILLFRKTP
jgi:hypothetical protein